MARTGGELTKAKILKVAEELFSTKGYDAASIGAIAKATGINKATIYYHFKDKKEILQFLLSTIVDDMRARLTTTEKQSLDIAEKIKKEMIFLRSKKKILTVMLMESLKGGEGSYFLFSSMNEVIKKDIIEHFPDTAKMEKEKRDLFYVHEFFTGLMPIISYVVFEDKWPAFFDVDKKKVFELFSIAFKNSHINSHIN